MKRAHDLTRDGPSRHIVKHERKDLNSKDRWLLGQTKETSIQRVVIVIRLVDTVMPKFSLGFDFGDRVRKQRTNGSFE